MTASLSNRLCPSNAAWRRALLSRISSSVLFFLSLPVCSVVISSSSSPANASTTTVPPSP
eukprot:CAMPEP_0198359468 /NCGR_PEP_ID=MMETSP1450-20131203/134724_1 /TAXON_ID=753684 ORGANISM="Madagascaria erythrocladiodes, Strain CCMP3234" /NCGR_SAMPLE_ID=MMETSP1450 /ASSEMBLY_ACC=CAM_ASM_001115 /LENGTH=59 /DNA_ID=CAMNT_0044066343 /DNA_START=305 /DNA_END=481 /DNA_ORIENTATION=+